MNTKLSVEENFLLTSEKNIESKKYWLDKLGLLHAREKDHIFPGALRGLSPEMKQFLLDPSVAAELLKLCNGNELSVYIYIMTAFGALIGRYAGDPMICILSPRFREGTNNYNATLPIVFAPGSGDSFKQQLIGMRETVVGVIRHQHYPIERVMQELGIDAGMLPNITGACASIHATDTASSSPFGISIRIESGQVELVLSTVAELPFRPDAFFSQLHRLIAVSLSDLNKPVREIEILWPGERKGVLELSGIGVPQEGSRSAAGFRFVQRLRRRLSDGDNNIAVEYRGKTLSYAALDTLVCKLSDFLSSRLRLSKGDRVVVMIDRSEWMIILPVTLFQRGLVYVPIDINNPEDRIRDLLNDIRPALVITDPSLFHLTEELHLQRVDTATLSRVLDACEQKALPLACCEEDEAYIIYTSGSTGRPKGTIVTHGNLDHFFGQIDAEYGYRTSLDLPFVASNAFDISLFQLLTPLITGGKVVIADKEQLLDPDQLLSLLKNVTAIDTVPALYGQLVQLISGSANRTGFSHIRRVFIGGDRIPDGLLVGLATVFPNAGITVTYGPTEATMFCTSLTYLPGTIVAATKGTVIGRPLLNGRVYVLGEDLQLLPPGMEGEICIGGPGVSKGYLKREELTEEKFQADPYVPASRIYRTGDIGRWNPQGMLEFRGRKDSQVKVHGYRIELGEIESCMLHHPAIQAAAVAAPLLSNGERSLAGYFVKKRIIQVWPSISEYMGYNEVAYFAMNNDAQRVGSYRRAIARVARGKVMIDVGTGPEAILAQYCIQAGAVRVYAIELIEEAYHKAKNTIASLGLQNKIIVIHGNVMDVELPEKADYCVCALVGNMGSTDGCIPIMNSARRLLKDNSCMIPCRSVTSVAAVDLRDELVNYSFTQTGAQYVKEIFEFTGGSFDLRVGLQNIVAEDLISTTDVFEDLDLSCELPLEDGRDIELTITSDAEITGFVVWLHLHTGPGIVYDIFPNQQSFLPIYWPVFEIPERVSKGDRITARTWRAYPEGMICPDLGIEGQLIRKDGTIVPFYYLSRKRRDTFSSGSFYSRIFPGGKLEGKPTFSSQVLEGYLKSKLPEHMVPPVLIQLESLPLTANGKIDQQQLLNFNIREEDSLTRRYVAPANEVESALALIWQNLLGVARVGVHDNFFRIGGDSISTIQMVNRARRAGYELRVADIFAHPTIAGLGSWLAEQGKVTLGEPGEQGRLTGTSGLLPPQQWYLETNVDTGAYFNQSTFLSISRDIGLNDLENAVRRLLDHHDGLRSCYKKGTSGWQQEFGQAEGRVAVEDLRTSKQDELLLLVEKMFQRYHQSLNIEAGELVRVVWIQTPATETDNRLLIIIHHLVVDNVSWRILLEDLEMMVAFLKKGNTVELGRKTTSLRQWHQALERYSKSERLLSQLPYWKKAADAYSSLPVDTGYNGAILIGDIHTCLTRLSQDQTSALLQYVPRLHDTSINDVLITALALSLTRWTRRKEVVLALEGHGREDIGERTDLSRTVGWLSDIYPVLLEVESEGNPGVILKKIRDQLRDVPDKGIGYGVLKEINGEQALQGAPWDIVFNYLGVMDSISGRGGWFSRAHGPSVSDVGASFAINEKLSVTSVITSGELHIHWKYSGHHYNESTIKELSASCLSSLRELLHYCTEYRKSEDIYASVEYDIKANNAQGNADTLSKKRSDTRTILDF